MRWAFARGFLALAIFLSVVVTAAPAEGIVGGTDVAGGDASYAVRLFRTHETNMTDTGASSCGGAIVSDTWVVTAAHCVDGMGLNRIVSGSVSRPGGDGATVHRIAETVIPTDYDSDYYGYDIALLRIGGSFDSDLRRLRLPTAEIAASATKKEASLRLTGWGLTSQGTQPYVLQKADFTPQDVCDHGWDQICMKGTAPPHPASCQGDSGSPLTYESANVTYLIGVAAAASTGGCLLADIGVYTGVRQHSFWINSILNDPSRRASTDPDPSSLPTGFTAHRDSTGVQLFWTDNSEDEDGFRVRRENGGVVVAEVGSDERSAKDSNPPSGDLRYVLEVFNANGFQRTLPIEVATIPTLFEARLYNGAVAFGWARHSGLSPDYIIEERVNSGGMPTWGKAEVEYIHRQGVNYPVIQEHLLSPGLHIYRVVAVLESSRTASAHFIYTYAGPRGRPDDGGIIFPRGLKVEPHSDGLLLSWEYESDSSPDYIIEERSNSGVATTWEEVQVEHDPRLSVNSRIIQRGLISPGLHTYRVVAVLEGYRAASTPVDYTYDPPEEPLYCMGLEVTVDLAKGQVATAGDDVILGTPHNDYIVGFAGNDTICGMGGADMIYGDEGDDVIDGGDGSDDIRGNTGNDTMIGAAGNDELYGGEGQDNLNGGEGSDRIFGGDGEYDICRSGDDEGDFIDPSCELP